MPALHAWAPCEHALHVVDKARAKDDPAPQAWLCYGVLRRATSLTPEQRWRRCASGQPVRARRRQCVVWCGERLAALGKRALRLVWDHAAWHKRQLGRPWRRTHHVERTGSGVRIVLCVLPRKSPWRHPLEPTWVHGIRAVVDPARVLTAQVVAERVCAYSGGAQEAPLSISEKAA